MILGVAVIVYLLLILLGAAFLSMGTKTLTTPEDRPRMSATSKTGAGTRRKKGSFTIPKKSGTTGDISFQARRLK